MSDTHVYSATKTVRGCGYRKAGGLYAEAGFGPDGKPLDEFLFDAPIPVPDGLDIINKPQLYLDAEGAFGEAGLYHLLIHVGSQHYPYVADYIEEVRQYGASRRLPARLDLAKLTPHRSRMLMAHSAAYNAAWAEQAPPDTCRKLVHGHSLADPLTSAEATKRAKQLAKTATAGKDDEAARAAARGFVGPCLYQTYELIPAEAGELLEASLDDGVHARPVYLRTHATTSYAYSPSGAESSGLAPAFFAALPLSCFAMITDHAGNVAKALKDRVHKSGFSYYESPD